MLVLGRKIGQQITIGDTVLTILDIKGSRVSVGVEAPRNLRVLRGELADASDPNRATARECSELVDV